MEMASGVYFDLLNPSPSDVRLDDIAHHLAQINRYTGACRRPMSVAEHALLVADRLRSRGHGAATIMRGLHHDDPEAYAGDVGRPLKLALGTVYSEIEANIAAVIVDALALPGEYDAQAVKDADDWALAAEAWHLLPSRGEGWFCWGHYDPTDHRNPPAVFRLVDREATHPAIIKTLFLSAHRRWTDMLASIPGAR